MHMYACIGLSPPKPRARSGPPRSESLTGRRDRIAFYPSVQLFLLFILSKLSRDRRYSHCATDAKTLGRIAIRYDPKTFRGEIQPPKSFRCHTSRKCARNSFGCHTYRIGPCKSFPCHTSKKRGGGGELWLTPPGTRPRYGARAIFARKGGRTEWSRASFSVRFPVRVAGEQSVDESNLVADKQAKGQTQDS